MAVGLFLWQVLGRRIDDTNRRIDNINPGIDKRLDDLTPYLTSPHGEQWLNELLKKVDFIATKMCDAEMKKMDELGMPCSKL